MSGRNLARPEPDQLTAKFDRAQNGNVQDEPERDLWLGGYSGKAMFGSWLAGAVITATVITAMLLVTEIRQNVAALLAGTGLLALMWIYLIGIMIYRKLSVHYHITTQRIKHREGFLVRKMDLIEMIDVDDVNYRQGFIQLLVGVGDITVRSSDTSHPVFVLQGIRNVKQVADLIDEARRKERRSRGLHFEQI